MDFKKSLNKNKSGGYSDSDEEGRAQDRDGFVFVNDEFNGAAEKDDLKNPVGDEHDEDVGPSTKFQHKPNRQEEEAERCYGMIDIHMAGSGSDQNLPLTSATLRRPRVQSPYEQSGLCGLRNIGNTCFMNSVLQCLSNTEALLDYILISKGYLNDINSNSSMKGGLINAYAKLIQDIWTGHPHDVDTSNLKGQIQKFAPVFRGARQHDSQELLRYLLEGLHNDVNRVKAKPNLPPLEIEDSLDDEAKAVISWQHYQKYDNSKIGDIFVGQLKSTLTCGFCGYRSVTFDPFWDLSIPLPSPRTTTGPVKLEQCLQLFTNEETLDRDDKPYCAKCKCQRKCTKRFSIEKFPNVLVIHLKRFSSDDRGKLRTAIKFPMAGLDMGQFSEPPTNNCSYNLYGISNHYGTAFSGHYIGYCKHPYSMEWHCYDDSRVSKTTEEHVSEVEGYVLFYAMSEASKCVRNQ